MTRSPGLRRQMAHEEGWLCRTIRMDGQGVKTLFTLGLMLSGLFVIA
ncbi:hypothetical protein [Vulcanisaeta sp. JCM 16161]|nr:hypothetical protein [Vulcanisaeta sp. JCM 16161]